MNKELMETARQIIEENYSYVFGVAELCEMVGVSKEHLVRSFKQCFGVTPGTYITEVRLKKAKELLTETDYPLKVIAAMCGYSGEGYFGKAYRKHFGVSPGSERKKNVKRIRNDSDEIAQMFYL